LKFTYTDADAFIIVETFCDSFWTVYVGNKRRLIGQCPKASPGVVCRTHIGEIFKNHSDNRKQALVVSLNKIQKELERF